MDEEPRADGKCPACGKENPTGNRFCGQCGKALPLPSPPLPAPPPPPAPPPAAAVPADPLARERELQRLLTLANVQRMRALVTDARRTLELARVLAETMAPPVAAPVHEAMGDLMAQEERWEQARDAYARGLECDPTRAGLEKKFAAVTVKLADEEALQRMGDALLRGGSLPELLAQQRAGRRPAGLAMALSLILPGMGQFYTGHFIKGAVCLALFSLSLLTLAVSGQREAFLRTLVGFFQPAAAKGVGPVSPLLWAALLGVVATWLYALIDAPLSAGRVPPHAAGPAVDKSGWEV